MAKLILDPIGNFNSTTLTTINTNSDRIEAAMENTLSRDGTTPNQMEADLDMNNFDILNVGTVFVGDRPLGDGWSPLLRVVADGSRRVLELFDWTGGQTLKPTLTGYLGATEIVPLIADAVDIRGPQGPAGAGTGDMLGSVYDPQNIEEDIFSRVELSTVVEAESTFLPTVAPEFIRVAGFTSVGDGGDALYVNPVTVDPLATDQIEILAGITPTYYNRLHNAGEFDFAKHGMFLDGREETALFEDAFTAALNRGLSRMVMPGGRSVLLTEARIPLGSFEIDLHGSTILADFNGAVPGATANAIRACNFNNVSSIGTNFGDMILNGGLASIFDTDTVKINTEAGGKLGETGYAGKIFPEARRIFRAVVYGTSNVGYVNSSNPSVTLTLYGKNTLPASVTDGTILGTLNFTDTDNESLTWREVVSTDQKTEYTHVWVGISAPGAVAVNFANVQIWGESPYIFSMNNMVLDGQRDILVTLTDQRRVFDVEGYRTAFLRNSVVKHCAKGGTTATPILYRDDRHTQFQNCGYVGVENLLLEANRNSEGLTIQSSDEQTIFHVKNLRCLKQEASGSAIGILNCGRGKIEGCYIDGMTGSGMNVLSRYTEVCFNVVKNISSSVGIDCKEGNIYSHGSWIHHNWVENTSSTGIVACGNGVRIENNYLKNCLHGIDVNNGLGTLATTHGDWLDGTVLPISGVKVLGNRHFGHNQAADGNNSNVRILGESTNYIEAEVHVTDDVYASVLTENGIWAQYANLKISGELKHGRTALLSVQANCGKIEFNGAILNPQLTQSVSGVVTIGANIDKLIFTNSEAKATFDVGSFHITNSAGSYTEIQFNNSPTIGVASGGAGGINVPVNTRVLRDGKIYKAITPKTIVGSLTGGARLSATETVAGVRLGTDEVIKCTNVSADTILADAYVSADNQVTVVYRNSGEGLVTDPSSNLRITVGPRGHSV